MSWVFRRLRRKRTVWCYCVLFVCSRGYHFESAYTQLKKRWVILTKTSQTPLVWQLIPRRRTWSQHLIASRFRQIIIKDSQRVPNLVKTLFFDKFFLPILFFIDYLWPKPIVLPIFAFFAGQIMTFCRCIFWFCKNACNNYAIFFSESLFYLHW